MTPASDWTWLVSAIASDSAVPLSDWSRIAVIARVDGGVATDDAFAWANGEAPTRFITKNDDIAEWLWDLCASNGARVAVVTLRRGESAATLNLIHGQDADHWFVPLGSEALLAELVNKAA